MREEIRKKHLSPLPIAFFFSLSPKFFLFQQKRGREARMRMLMRAPKKQRQFFGGRAGSYTINAERFRKGGGGGEEKEEEGSKSLTESEARVLIFDQAALPPPPAPPLPLEGGGGCG